MVKSSVNRKIILFTIFIGFLVSQVSGYELSKQDNWNTTFDPGESSDVGTLQINNDGNQTMENVNVTFNGYPFITQAKPKSFNIPQESAQATKISFNIPDGFTSGSINGEVVVSGDNFETKRLEHTIEIRKVEKWTFSGEQFNVTANSGENGVIGTFDIDNEGNTDIDFKTNYTGNASKYSSVIDQFRIFRGAERSFQVGYNIPSGLEPMVYNGTIKIIGGNRSIERNVSLDVVDNIEPDVSDVKVPEKLEATRPVNIEAIISDNVGIDDVYVEFWYKTVNNTNKIAQTNLSKVDNTQEWETDYSGLTRRGEYLIKLKAVDTSGNIKLVERNMTLEGLNAVNNSKNIIFPSARSGTQVQEKFMELNTDVPVTVKLEEGQNNGKWSLGFVLPNGNRKFIDSVNESVTLREEGDYTIRYESDAQGSYFGTLEYNTIEEHVPINSTTYSGKMTNYTVPESFEKSWVGDSKLDCDVVDNGIKEESYRTCTVNYTLDSSIEKNTVVPVSPNRLEEFKSSVRDRYKTKLDNAQNETATEKTKKNSQKIQKWFLALMLVGMSGYGYYIIEIKPYTRWRMW